MNKFEKLKMKLLARFGVEYEMIKNIPDHYYNKLRYMYYRGLPISFYLLFDGILPINDITKAILFTKVFDTRQDYRIVNADLKTLGNHTFIECDDEVFDISLNKIINKDYYYKIFNPMNMLTSSKEDIISFIKHHKINDCRLEDAFGVPLEIFEQIEELVNNYDGDRKELLDRQVNSYFNDINYDDGMIIINIKK